MLESAKQKLATMFHFGICEWLEPSVDLLCCKLGRPHRRLNYRLNSAPDSTAQNLLAPNDLAYIQNLNRFDMELYEFARQLLRQRLIEFWGQAGMLRTVEQFDSILKNYTSRSNQARIRQHLLNQIRFAEHQRSDQPEQIVDFSKMAYESGWYPRSKNQFGNFIRWAGPETTSSVFVSLNKRFDYQFSFTAQHFMRDEFVKKMKICVGNSVIKPSCKKVPSETRRGYAFEVSGLIPASSIRDNGQYTEVVFQSVGTHKQKVDYDEQRHVSFATDRIMFSPQREGSRRSWLGFG